MSNKVLELKKVSKHYIQGGSIINVLDEISLSIDAGEVVSIIGSSGSGKSTLLHIAGLLDNPSSGSIYIKGINTSNSEHAKAQLRLQDIGFIYQFHHLLNDFTVIENIVMPQIILGTKSSSTRATELMNLLNIEDRALSYPSQLSGGQQQRVAIARALVNYPTLILADEPTGNLDSKNAFEVFDLIQNIAKNSQTSFLIATHNLILAEKSDKIFQLKEQKLSQIK